jgi:virulence-associated protein VapD
MQQKVATLKIIFEDNGYNFKKDWWATVDVTEPTEWFYPCYTNAQVFEMLEIFNDMPAIDRVEVIY